MARVTLIGQQTDWLRLAEIAAAADLGITICETAGPVLETLVLQTPDLIFVDAWLADLTCAEFLARLRYLSPSLPVVVALPIESTDRLALLEAGASDLLRAPVEPLEFVTRLHTMLALMARSNEPGTTPAPLAKPAPAPLPPSERSTVIEAIDSVAGRADAATARQALHLVHLGAVAEVNADLGRAIGDRLIEAVADAIRQAAKGALVARVAGDCFAVVETSAAAPDDRPALADRLARAASGPFPIAGERLTSAISIGIARFPRDGRSGEALYRSAMQALLQARAAAGDQVIIEAASAPPDAASGEPANERAQPQEDAATALAGALGGPDLDLVFQPQVDLATGEFSGVEAFVRWLRPGHGAVPPRTLFQIAGTGALLARLSDEILARAVAAHETFTRAGLGDLRISLNVSAAQLRLIAAERGTGARFVPEGRRIEFEIPAALASDASYLPALTALKVEGFGLCLDCTGRAPTGATALPEQPRVAVDRVKIDMQDPDRLAAQAAFAQTLQCPVIGGNIEEASQLTELRTLGGATAQGYYIQRPIPLDAFIALARSARIEGDV
jgi:diguanylate cyclase (GGDEF)-like protein